MSEMTAWRRKNRKKKFHEYNLNRTPIIATLDLRNRTFIEQGMVKPERLHHYCTLCWNDSFNLIHQRKPDKVRSKQWITLVLMGNGVRVL